MKTSHVTIGPVFGEQVRFNMGKNLQRLGFVFWVGPLFFCWQCGPAPAGSFRPTLGQAGLVVKTMFLTNPALDRFTVNPSSPNLIVVRENSGAEIATFKFQNDFLRSVEFHSTQYAGAKENHLLQETFTKVLEDEVAQQYLTKTFEVRTIVKKESCTIRLQGGDRKIGDFVTFVGAEHEPVRRIPGH